MMIDENQWLYICLISVSKMSSQYSTGINLGLNINDIGDN